MRKLTESLFIEPRRRQVREGIRKSLREFLRKYYISPT
jgi:hypothetical protein